MFDPGNHSVVIAGWLVSTLVIWTEHVVSLVCVPFALAHLHAVGVG